MLRKEVITSWQICATVELSAIISKKIVSRKHAQQAGEAIQRLLLPNTAVTTQYDLTGPCYIATHLQPNNMCSDPFISNIILPQKQVSTSETTSGCQQGQE